MWQWTWKSLLSDRWALCGSVAAAGSALLLVMIFEAVYAGESEQIVAYVRHAEADVWVMQRGVSNMHMASSYLSDEKLARVREVPGVARAAAILYLNTVTETGSQRWFAYIVGLDAGSAQTGPWAMHSGRAQPRPGEAVIPAVLAGMGGVGIGDRTRVTDREFTIAGLSAGTFSMANAIVFVNRADLEDIMSSPGVVSYVLVVAEPGVDPAALASDIERDIDKVHALTADQFVSNDRRMAMQMGVETIALMTAIGGALTVLLVAFTIYSSVARQRRELAVAKALGVSNRSLYLSVGVQSVVIVLAAVVLATGLALVVMPLATALIPQVTLKFTAVGVIRIALLGVAVALLASVIPARQIARVDPLSAFQS